MLKKANWIWLAASLSIGIVACGDMGGGGPDAGKAPATCESMCTHLLSEILDGCMKTDSQDECVKECTEHQAEGEFDQDGLECAAKAGTCEAWRLCGDIL